MYFQPNIGVATVSGNEWDEMEGGNLNLWGAICSTLSPCHHGLLVAGAVVLFLARGFFQQTEKNMTLPLFYHEHTALIVLFR